MALRPAARISSHLLRHLTSTTARARAIDVDALLREPSWSIASLLPPSAGASASSSSPSPSSPSAAVKQHAPSSGLPDITPADLARLSALSALPVPADPAPSLAALRAHVHFVSRVREAAAATAGLRPLQRLGDETAAGAAAAEFGLAEMRTALEGEQVVGKFHRRIRRGTQRRVEGEKVGAAADMRGDADAAATATATATRSAGPSGLGTRSSHADTPEWDVLGHAQRRVGRYFVVEREWKAGEAGDGD